MRYKFVIFLALATFVIPIALLYYYQSGSTLPASPKHLLSNKETNLEATKETNLEATKDETINTNHIKNQPKPVRPTKLTVSVPVRPNAVNRTPRPTPTPEDFSDNDLSPVVQIPSVKKTRVIMYKTHKTASTTMGSILFRFGLKNNLTFYMPTNSHYATVDVNAAFDPTKTADIQFRHHSLRPGRAVRNSRSGNFLWQDAESYYKRYIPEGQLISIVRDPVKRFISDFNFFRAPDVRYKRTTLERFVEGRYPESRYMNIDFGLPTEAAARYYVRNSMHGVFMLITERFSESLVLLTKIMGWSLQDVLYVPLFDSCATGVRWDGKKVACIKNGDTSTKVINKIKSLASIKIDQIIYDAALKRHEQLVAAQPATFLEEVEELNKMLEEVKEECKSKTQEFLGLADKYKFNITYVRDKFGDKCTPYVLTDLGYESVTWSAQSSGLTLHDSNLLSPNFLFSSSSSSLYN